MIEWIDRGETACFGVRLRGAVTQAEFRDIAQRIDRQIDADGPLRLLVDAEELDRVSPRALWDDLKFRTSHARDLKKLALVGDHGWLRAWTRLLTKLMPVELRSFATGQSEQAWRWLRV